ncbi:MAG: hypothetical protein NTV57_18880 [Cyanobacteria bacterium]|nr:hypothetical protein [Cyanobacteriota bacterium]
MAMSLLAATAQAALLAWIVSWVALDQPSQALLVLSWGQQWVMLLATCTAACLLIRPEHGRAEFRRHALLLWLTCMVGLALCFLAGGLAGLLEQLRLTTVFSGLPHPGRQAAAEAMLAMAEWSGLPLAGAMVLALLRPWRAKSGR